MNFSEFKDHVIRSAGEKKLTEYELYYTETEDISVEALMHELSKFSTSTDAGACFRCIYNNKMGYASTELFTASEAEHLVERAMENAAVIESQDKVFIHEAGDEYHWPRETLQEEPKAKELVESVMKLEDMLYKKDERVKEGSEAFAGYVKRKVALCNSKGLDLSYDYAYSQMGAVVTAEQEGQLYNGYKIKTNDFKKLASDMDGMAGETVQKVIASFGSDTVASGIYDVIFSNEMMATVLSTFSSSFSADAARRGLSLFQGKEGQEVAAKQVTITDDPFCAESFIKMPFDGEGVATYKKNVVENGTLVTLLHNLTTAHEAGVTSTGNGRKPGYASNVTVMPYNFFLAPGEAGTKEDIFKLVGNGIYITSLNGLHAGANPVTGDFSLSSEGFLIEGGKMTKPVKNFTISGNFYEILKKISVIGSDFELGNPQEGCCFGAPTTVVKEISVAGK